MIWLYENLTAIVGIITGMTALGALAGGAFAWLRRQIKKSLPINIGSDIAAIRKELTTNGGTSLKDVLMRVAAIQWAEIEDSEKMRFEADHTGSWIRVNRAFLDKTDMQLYQVLYNGWSNCVARAHVAEVRTRWGKAVEEDRDFDEKFELLGEDGLPFEVRVRARRITNSGGKTTGWLGTVFETKPKPQS